MSASVYIGPWVDYSRGSVLGATITLAAREGAFLVAALSIFLTFVGSQFWTILSFVIHQLNTTKKATDALHCQHQVVFRNSGTSLGAARELFSLSFSWRRPPDRKFWSKPFWSLLGRSWAWAFVAAANFGAWAAASLFSSEVTKAAGHDILINPGSCGQVTDVGSLQGLFPRILNDTITAASYARSCYGNQQSPVRCDTFVKQQLPFHTNPNASCPFETGYCSYSDSAALELATEHLDSHIDLGINAPAKDRVTYRKVTTCGVINAKIVKGATKPNSDTGYVEYYLGSSPLSGTSFTFQHSQALQNSDVGYLLNTARALATVPESGAPWVPLNAFNRTDSDLSLIWLSTNALYSTEAIGDPFFGFNQYGSISGLFSPDHLVNVMACTDQHQYCNANLQAADEGKYCTSLAASLRVKDELSKIQLTGAQLATARLIFNATYPSVIAESVFGRSNSALLANELVLNLQQLPLPNNQWMIEVTNWFATSLARLQHGLVQYVTGPAAIQSSTYIEYPTDPFEQKLCTTQKIPNSGGYVLFSTLGLVITIAVGTLIILVSLFLEDIVCYVYKRWDTKHDYRRLQWILDGKFQLQRMAYQYAGLGEWEKKDGNVPVTVGMARVFPSPIAGDRKNLGFSEEPEPK